MAEPKVNELMEKIVSLCKRRGFIFQSSEIYGGINGFWDYGPLGAELKRNVKEPGGAHDRSAKMSPAWKPRSSCTRRSGKPAAIRSTFTDLMVDCLLYQETLPRRPDRSAEWHGYHYDGREDPVRQEESTSPSPPSSCREKPTDSARKTGLSLLPATRHHGCPAARRTDRAGREHARASIRRTAAS